MSEEDFVADGRRWPGANQRTAQIIIRVTPELRGRALAASRKLNRSLTGLIEGYLEDLVRRTFGEARRADE